MAKLQIWWIANVPGRAFRFDVKDEREAGMLLEALEYFDLALGDEVISNAGGLDEWDEIEGKWDWYTYYNVEGEDFNYIMKESREADESFYVPASAEEFRQVCAMLAKYREYLNGL